MLIKDGGLVKTVRFVKPVYVGDPINAIKIFNDKEVDELVVLDIDATGRGNIDFGMIARINKEAFMPLAYGGGVKTPDDVKRVLGSGYEKVIINSRAIDNLDIIEKAAYLCGSSSVVACVDVARTAFGKYAVYDYRRGRRTAFDPVDWAKRLAAAGAGELILYSVDRDGTYRGYDTELIRKVAPAVSIPLVALGGASATSDFAEAVAAGASAVAAGSMFVFHGPHKAVLITYPDKRELKSLLP